MFRQVFIFCIFFITLLKADYNNITLPELLKKVGLLNNINIIIPSDLNASRRYTFTINNFIKAKDLLKASEAILKAQGYKLSKLNKSFYIVEKTKDKRHNYIYAVKNSNSEEIIKKLNILYPGEIFRLGDKYILIKYSKYTHLIEILRNIKKIDVSPSNYYIAINIYNTDTNALARLGINLNDNTGALILKDKIDTNLLPNLLSLLKDNKKSKLIASPKLFLSPDKNVTAIFKEVTTIPIEVKKVEVLPGTNPTITTTTKTIYKEVGLILKLKYITHTEDNKVKLKLKLNDSNIVSYNEAGITTTKRAVEAIIQSKINKTIFIAGLSKTIKSNRIVGVPILKDIPLIKYLFSRKEESRQNRTLIITIKITKI